MISCISKNEALKNIKMFHKRDLFWLLAYPIYQTIGTFRHEASHALVAMMEGATITDFVFWPSFTKFGFYWGYVRYTGTTDWVCDAAPYLCDLLLFALFFLVIMRAPITKKWIWLNLIVIGLVSSFVNSFYNYCGSAGPRNDIDKLLDILPSPLVHGYFIITLSVYILGIIIVFKYSGTAIFLKTRLMERQ